MLCFVAVAALLPTAASLAEFRSTPAGDCEVRVLLERRRLQAEHTRSVNALEKMYESRIAELAALVAALGGATNAAARDVASDLALLPRTPLLNPDTSKGSAGNVRPTGAVARLGELRKSAPSRALLQTERFCSMDELMSVQKDAEAAVMGMLTTNVGCASCLMPCASAENVLGCAMACVKQVPPKKCNHNNACMAHMHVKHCNAPPMSFVCSAVRQCEAGLLRKPTNPFKPTKLEVESGQRYHELLLLLLLCHQYHHRHYRQSLVFLFPMLRCRKVYRRSLARRKQLAA